MRVQKIRLQKYGPFEDESFSLGSECSVIYGQNEAGKSTLLNALGDFLWGYSSRNHPRAFTYAAGKMLLTGTVAAGGQQNTWTRRLKKLSDAAGTEVIPPWDPQQTGSMKEWLQGFGLDLDHLQRGSEDLIAGGGDLADVIFLAETGVAIKKVREKLEKRMDNIYKERANARSEVREVLHTIENLTAQIEASEASAGDIAELRSKRDQLEQEKNGQDKSLRSLERDLRRLEELGRCFEKAAELRETEVELKDVLGSGPTLNRADTEQLKDGLESIASTGKSIGAGRLKLGGLESDMEQLELHPEVTKQARSIKDLGHRLQAVEDDGALLRDVGKNDALESIVLGLLHELGVEPNGRLDACVSGLRIAGDERDQLNRVATELSDTQKELDRERTSVRKAEVALQDLDDSADVVGKDSALVDARSRRDEVWSSIKKPWLSGEFPTEVDRDEMAQDLDAGIRGADQIAESQARQLTDAAKARGLRQAGEKEVNRKHGDLDAAQERFDEVRELWDDLVIERGLAKNLDPEAWSVRALALGKLEVAWKDLRQHGLERDEAKRNVDAFTDDVDKLIGLLDGDEQDPLRRVETLGDLLDGAIATAATSAAIEKQMSELHDELQKQERASDLAEAAVAQTTERHGDKAESLLERSEQSLGLGDQQSKLTEQLKSLKNPGSDLKELLGELANLDEVDRIARFDSRTEDVDSVKGIVGGLQSDLGSVNSELANLESRGSVTQLTAERLAEGERLRALVDEYRLLRLQVDMLDRYFEQAAEQSHSPVLDAAGEFLSKLTLGRYVGFEIITDEDRNRIEILYRDQPDEAANPMKLSELSVGTADQVYLALRLAGIEARQAQRKKAGLPTLPVVLDDVLVAHDDRRSAQALEVLAELSKEFQIILLTHHRSVLESSQAIPGITSVQLASVDSVDV